MWGPNLAFALNGVEGRVNAGDGQSAVVGLLGHGVFGNIGVLTS